VIKILLGSLALTFVATVATAQVGPPTSQRPCAANRALVIKDGAVVEASELSEFLGARVAKWQVPERWSFIDEVPKTSVGKFDKKVLRARHEKGDLDVELLD